MHAQKNNNSKMVIQFVGKCHTSWDPPCFLRSSFPLALPSPFPLDSSPETSIPYTLMPHRMRIAPSSMHSLPPYPFSFFFLLLDLFFLLFFLLEAALAFQEHTSVSLMYTHREGVMSTNHVGPHLGEVSRSQGLLRCSLR